MKSSWVDRDADACVDRYGSAGIGSDVALCVYATRLLGQDPRLVLHGGGNTSVKTRIFDLVGDEVEAMCVKGTGLDMATIEPAGLPAMRLATLRTLRGRADLSDDDMLRIQRASLIDPMAPMPSVESLLHAFLPHKFVDHTHSTAVLSLSDQPDGASICAEVFDGRLAVVPYLRPGFGLARKAADVFETAPTVDGLILSKHGIFTFGASAREAYERMIEMTSLAEQRLARGRRQVFVAGPLPQRIAALAEVAPVLRGACSLPDPVHEGQWRRLILEFRSSPAILAFVNGAEVARYSQAGVVTPDHIIRTKGRPLLVPAPQDGRIDEFKAAATAAAATFVDAYRDCFARNNLRFDPPKRMLDPLPRIALVPGLGLFGLGRSKQDAVITADIAESWVGTVADAEAIGRFEAIDETSMFDMEYWSPEQAKLGQAADKPLAGQIALVTGAGGAIGAAIARAFAAAGAEVALFDIDAGAARATAEAIGGSALAVACDVTEPAAVGAAFDRVVQTFGGLDILVSNAGAAWQGRIGEVDEAILRKSFELNFFAHQRVAQHAVRIMLAQGTGGALLFNVSKQAINPGPNLGPYGLPKAATLFLMRQYALDYGAHGIRANAVNPDRIRSGLVTADFIAQRAKARGVTEHDYMAGNLLGREVTADDVAQAFLDHALALKTTADVTTVDGGNIAAALR
ncbi:MAG: bifunctional aldolase/short-chain dehydrogenase [Xanthobacteraceae bacterium]|jgi:rhamnose utilization protein RhaD (predicted bifunctional aldolase and dehydrogenase)/NAD(P)-dependent dehydrogenase (short-subunit alcohol dehydrogenase family)